MSPPTRTSSSMTIVSGQPHCDTLGHQALPLSLPSPRFGARQIGAIIHAEGIIRLARHRGDGPRPVRLEPRLTAIETRSVK